MSGDTGNTGKPAPVPGVGIRVRRSEVPESMLRTVAALKRHRSWRTIRELAADAALHPKITQINLRQLAAWGVVEAMRVGHRLRYRLDAAAEHNDHYVAFQPFLLELGW